MTVARGTLGVTRGLAVVLLCAGCAGVGDPVPGAPAHHRERGFANTNPEFAFPSSWTVNAFRARRLWAALVGSDTVTLPRVANDGRALRENHAEPTVTWIGHATLLIQLDGVNVLTDPHWSERASPFSFVGPRRLQAPGLAFEDLPPIHLVVISHDHYDQLDAPTVTRLAATHRPLFLVPLGLKAWFAELGISEVEELDWWQSRPVRGLTLVCLPAQHWSQRTLSDRNRRLWASWAVLGRDRRMFFSGDTGYYEGFKEIGSRLGPFDLAATAIGVYTPTEMMKMAHVSPEEALRIFLDVGGQRFLGIHWGTFPLADEPIDEPPRRLEAEARRVGLGPDRVWVFQHGETRSW
jgi:N-acyl-phosphatidylethanolamine-hydrolysing phospholipase D